MQNTYHHTQCTIIWASPYPTYTYKQHQTYHRYTWAPQLGELAGVPARPASVASGMGRVAFGDQTRALATCTSPARNPTNNPNRIVLVYQITHCLSSRYASSGTIHEVASTCPQVAETLPGRKTVPAVQYS